MQRGIWRQSRSAARHQCLTYDAIEVEHRRLVEQVLRRAGKGYVLGVASTQAFHPGASRARRGVPSQRSRHASGYKLAPPIGWGGRQGPPMV